MRTKRIPVGRGLAGLRAAREGLRADMTGPYRLDDPGLLRLLSNSSDGSLENPYKQLAWTFAGIRTIGNVSASIPIRVYQGKRPQYRCSPLVDPRGFVAERLRAEGNADGKKLVEDHAIVRLFEAPCPALSRSQLLSLSVVYLYTQGEFGWLGIDTKGQPVKRGVLPSELWVQRTKSWELVLGEQSKLPQTWKNGGKPIAAESLIHVKFPDPENPYRGYAPVEPARVDMEADLAAARFNHRFFRNGAHPGGILKNEKMLTPAQRKEMRAALDEAVKGDDKAFSTLLLEGGTDFLWNPRSHKDAEFPELRRAARDVQLAVLGVQKASLSITDDLNYATALGQRRLLVENTIIPLLVDFEDALWSQLFQHHEGGRYWVEWDFSSVPALQDDLGQRATTARTFFDMGYSRDEVAKRLALGFEPDPVTDVRGGPGALDLGAEEGAPTDTTTPTPKAGEGPQANAAAALAAGNAVQDLALNGAQIQSLVDLAAKVQAGELPAASAISIIVAAYPTIDVNEAKKIIDPAEAAAAGPSNNDPPSAPSSPVLVKQPNSTPAEGGASSPPPASTEPAEPRADEETIAFGHSLVLARMELDPETFRRLWRERVDGNIEKVVRRVMERYLAKLAKEQVQRFEAHVRELATQGLTEGDIDAILFNREEWDRFIKQEMGPKLKRAQDVASRRLARELGVKIIDINNPAMLEIHGAKVAKLVQVNAVTNRAIRSTLIQGVANSETIDDIRFRLNAVLEHIGGNDRALRIARTEVGMITQATRSQGMRDQGVTQKKWWSVLGEGTRETHRQEHGHVVGIAERFPVTKLLHPLEAGGEPDEIVNCDCDLLAVVEGI